MKCYEIHIYKDGAWQIDSVFDDSELVLHEARRMDEGGRHQAIRVIEENYDEEKDLTTCRTLFRGGRMPEKKKARSAPTPRPAAAMPSGSVGREPVHKGGHAPAAPQRTSSMMPLILATVIILGGGAALVALRYLSQMP